MAETSSSARRCCTGVLWLSTGVLWRISDDATFPSKSACDWPGLGQQEDSEGHGPAEAGQECVGQAGQCCCSLPHRRFCSLFWLKVVCFISLVILKVADGQYRMTTGRALTLCEFKREGKQIIDADRIMYVGAYFLLVKLEDCDTCVVVEVEEKYYY